MPGDPIPAPPPFDLTFFEQALEAKMRANPALALPYLLAAGVTYLVAGLGLVLIARALARRAREPATPGPPELPMWGALDVVAVIVAGQFGGMLVALALLKLGATGTAALVAPTVAGNGFVALLMLAVLKSRGQRPAALGLTGQGKPWLGTGIAQLLIAFPLYSAVSVLSRTMFDRHHLLVDPNSAAVVFLTTDSAADLAIIGAVAVIAAPFFEELIFRGFLYPALRAKLGREVAIGLTALPFALLHPLVDMPAILVLGAALGIAYERSGSLFAPMAAHVLNNAWGILMLAIQRSISRA